MCIMQSLLTPVQTLWQAKCTLKMSAMGKVVLKEKSWNFLCLSIMWFSFGLVTFKRQIGDDLREIIVKPLAWILTKIAIFTKTKSQNSTKPSEMYSLARDCHIFAHWGRSLCSKKCVQLVFSCFWLPIWCVLKFEKKLSSLWYTKFQLITVKYHEVEALFCKMSHHVEKLGSVHTKCQYQVTVFGTDPVLEIGTILRNLNGRNFLIPNPRELVDPSF